MEAESDFSLDDLDFEEREADFVYRDDDEDAGLEDLLGISAMEDDVEEAKERVEKIKKKKTSTVEVKEAREALGEFMGKPLEAPKDIHEEFHTLAKKLDPTEVKKDEYNLGDKIKDAMDAIGSSLTDMKKGEISEKSLVLTFEAIHQTLEGMGEILEKLPNNVVGFDIKADEFNFKDVRVHKPLTKEDITKRKVKKKEVKEEKEREGFMGALDEL